MPNRTTVTTGAFVIGVFLVLLLVGRVLQSGPSDAVEQAGRVATTTTTTEPPPEGVFVVKINNAVFRPSNVRIDLAEFQIIKWINEDQREYLLGGRDDLEGLLDQVLKPGDEYEFPIGDLPPGIYRYFAEVGFQRIPGSVDTRPEQ